MVKRNNRSFRKKQKSKKKINRKKIKQRTRKKYTKRRNAKRQIYRKVGGSSGAWPATKLEQVKNWLFINTGNPKYNSDALAGKVCDILRDEGIPEGEWISSLPEYFKREYLEMVLEDLLD